MLDAVPTEPRWQVVKSTADRLTKQYASPPIPVHRIAEENGVEVVFADFGKHSESVAGFCDFKRSKLFVNRIERTERQTFTIAHELGHWMLHKELFVAHPEEYPVLLRTTGSNRNNVLEKEANHFAANLLVPDHLLNHLRKAPASVLAQAFGVSATMMGFRLKNG